MTIRMGAVEGWAVTHDGETLKSGFKDDFEAVAWIHKRQSQSVDWAVKHAGYDIVLVRDGKVAYSFRRAQNPMLGATELMELGSRLRREEGAAYIDKQGGRWTTRWWSKDEQRYYSLPDRSTREEAAAYAREQGMNPVVAEPHNLRGSDIKSKKRPVPIWPKFVDAYLAAALWASSTGDDEEPLDNQSYTIYDFAQEAIDEAVEDSNKFIKANQKALESVGSYEQHGHDFWLTRNGHGAGFWDRGYGEVGKRLSDAARAYGETNAYAGDDGKIYFE